MALIDMKAVFARGLAILSLVSVASADTGTAPTVIANPDDGKSNTGSVPTVMAPADPVTATPVVIANPTADTGTATFYTIYTPSACYGYQDQGTMIAAASDPIYNNGAACGRMYRVTCTNGTTSMPACKGGSVTVKIVDRCPSPGCKATLDLSQEAFSVIANPDAGKINIEYVIDNGAIYESDDDNIICVSNSL